MKNAMLIIIKKWLLVFLVNLLFLIPFFPVIAGSPNVELIPSFPVIAGSLSGKKIGLDPGHGGSDPGAVGWDGPGYPNEEDFNLDVGLKLRTQLQSDGATVVMTRTTDTDVSPDARVNFINNENPHAFTSIHCNGFTDPSAHGTETYWHIQGTAEDQKLAGYVQNRLVEQLGTTNRGVKQADFRVLEVNSWIPAVLGEMLFISNQEEFNLINSASGKDKAVSGFRLGICDFFGGCAPKNPPIASASDITGQPKIMYPDTLYEVTAKYYDPDGRTNLKWCFLGLTHPTATIVVSWIEATNEPFEDSEYITFLNVDSAPITGTYEGYRLTWKFKISDTWPEAKDCIDFAVTAIDDDGLQSDWALDDTNASFVKPDLVVQNPVVTSSGPYYPGSSLSVSCVIKNQGKCTAGSSKVKYYLSTSSTGTDYYLGYDDVDSLSADGTSPESETVTIPSDIPCDRNYYVVFYADADGQVVESDENNNKNNAGTIYVQCQQHTVTITSGPTANPNPVESGKTTQLSVTATDSLGHSIAYSWTANPPEGSFSDASAQNPTWTAPVNNTGADKVYTLTVTAKCIIDPNVKDTKSVNATVKPASHTVTITSGPTANPATIDSGGTTNLSVTATDSLGHAIAYSWTANPPEGSFSDASAQNPTWTAPVNNTGADKVYTLTVTAKCTIDPNVKDTKSVNVTVKPEAEERLKWKFKTGERVNSSPAIGSDSTIYVGSFDYYLYAINPNGTQKWRFPTGGYVASSPAIGSDGTIYVGSFDGCLYAINPNGTQKWKFQTGDCIYYSSPAIGSDGTIYVGSDDHYLYAINSNGMEKWKFQTGSYVKSSPAIGSDGTIYVGSWDYYLYAINPDGTQKWRFLTGHTVEDIPPAIGSDGTIYVGSDDYYLSAINPDGTEKWKFQTGAGVQSSPAIGSDGTIYVGSRYDNLYAINPNGTEKWKFPGDFANPSIGSDGTIYVGSYHYLYAINPNGTEKWKFQAGDAVYSSPAIDSDGTIYVGSRDGYLYALNSDSMGLADSNWPKFRHDNQNTGRVSITQPDISVTPTSYDYGSVNVGEYKDNTFVVKNEGTALLSVSSTMLVGADASDFTIQSGGGSFDLNPGETRDIVVRFSPKSAGDKNATLRIASNDPDENPFDVTLKGSGIGDSRLKWKFKTGERVNSSPAIGSDSTIYVGSFDYYLYAINPDGTQKWRFQTGGSVASSPAIGSDGTIYVGSFDGCLYAINPDGTQKWKFQTGGVLYYSSPAIGSDGTIYVGSDDYYFYAINSNGTEKWKFQTGSYVRSYPAIGSDGTIYVWSDDNYLYAINPDGAEKWKFKTGGGVPSISSDRTIYVGSRDNYLYAINPDGTEKWKFLTGGDVDSSPSIGSDGTIYVGSMDNCLYAINPNGTQKWKFQGDLADSSPAIGSDGTIYVGSYHYLYAINPNGTEKWKFQAGDAVYSSPAIDSDGTIYVGSRDGYLYALNSDSMGLADSNWPKFRHDNQNTGRVPISQPDISVTPTSYDYGSVNVGEYKDNTFVVKNEGTALLSVSSTTLVGADASEFTIQSGGGSFDLNPGATRNIVVRFSPKSAGDKNAALRIASNDPDENPLDVTLKGKGVSPAPDIAVTPTSYDYGSVNVGEYKENTFVIKNEGSALLSVSSTTLVGADVSDFSIQSGGGSFDLNPGATRNIVVRFSPKSAGDKNATLRIASNDPDENPLDVPLSGTGAISPTEVDIITLDDAEGMPGAEVRIPLYIRDVNGTPLDADDAINKITAWTIQFSADNQYYQITGVERAGITAGSKPYLEQFHDGNNTWTVIYNTSAGNPPPVFTLDKPAPGDSIGQLVVKIADTEVDEDTPVPVEMMNTTTMLSNEGGTVGESVSEGTLRLVGGTLTILAFICGDTNGNGVGPDFLDVVYLLNYVVGGGPPPDPLRAGNVNGMGGVDFLDVVYLLNFVVGGGPAPVCSEVTTVVASVDIQTKDVLTLGEVSASAGETIRLPLYLQDVSGTPLDADDAINKIAAWTIRFSADNEYYQITGVERAGITAGLKPYLEQFHDGNNAWTVIYNTSAGNPPPTFTLDKPAPGDLIGELVITLSEKAEGDLLVEISDATLSNEAGTVGEQLVDGTLGVVAGTIHVESPLYGDVTGDGSVTALDAAVVLQACVGLVTLTPEQEERADVSGKNGVTAYDAALILRYVVGLIEKFPVEGGLATPANNGQNYTLSIGKVSARANERIVVPISVDDTNGILSGKLSLTYDATYLTPIDVQVGNQSFTSFKDMVFGKNSVSKYNVRDGVLEISFANEKELSDKGTLLFVEFEASNISTRTIPLTLSEAYLNEGLNTRKVDGWVKFIPETNALLNNFPNPFNPDTWIPYQLTESATVVIRIYNVPGQLVRILDIGYRQAGFYVDKVDAAYWDGRNASGERVASGVYFYQLEAGNFFATRKMTIIK